MGEPKERGLELLVLGGHPAELLAPSEQPLDRVPVPLRHRVKRPQVIPVPSARDDRAHVPVEARPRWGVAVEPLVPDQLVNRRNPA